MKKFLLLLLFNILWIIIHSVGLLRRLVRIMRAAFLSRGRFSFPHFGEYMHEGQPSLHWHVSISRFVAVKSLSVRLYRVSDMPIPPSNPS